MTPCLLTSAPWELRLREQLDSNCKLTLQVPGRLFVTSPIVGLHHVAAIASDPQANLDFYTDINDGTIWMANRPILSGLWEIVWSTGARRAEAARIKVQDIDSQRMVIHIRHGKGAKDREVPLSPKLLRFWTPCRGQNGSGSWLD